MRIFTFLFLLTFFLSPASANAQEVLCDNEDAGVCWSWDFNDALVFDVIDNPDSTDLNPSGKVLRYETDPANGFPIMVHDFAVNSEPNQDFAAWPVWSVKVWTAQTDGKVLWKFENSDNSASVERSLDVVPNEWQELVFDFTGETSTDFIKIVIFPDFGSKFRQGEWYFDDFTRWDALPATSNEEDLPLTFALEQNYPNPFNPSTQISFNMQEPGSVQLSIYDVKGNEVKQLMSGDQAAGQHMVRFNAEGLSSGVYFYRLAVNGVTVQRQMILNQ